MSAKIFMMILKIIFINLIFNFSITFAINAYVGSAPVRSVSERFISMSLDSYQAQSQTFYGLNFTYVVPLAKALSPAYFRFGGTLADNITFQESNPDKVVADSPHIILTAQMLDQLYKFSQDINMRLIFDLNDLLRNGSEWDPTNPIQLLNYASSKGYSMDFELGNEPENYPYFDNVTITGTQIAKAYGQLRNILNGYDLYKNSWIVGIETSSTTAGLWSAQKKILDEFFNNSGANYLNALSWHYYYENGHFGKLGDFLNITIMDDFLLTLNAMNAMNFTPLWLGETSSTYRWKISINTLYDGGTANISDRFAAGFLWLDKLGLGALYGLDVIIRQDLWGGNYALLKYNLVPNPDYWLTLIYKKLIGTQVFNVTLDIPTPTLRLYAGSSHNSNAIIVYGQNVANESISIDFPNATSRQATVYILKEADPGDLESKLSRVNGNLLNWTTHQPGPDIRGNVANLPITLPEFSQFYIVINQVQLTQCPSGWFTSTTTSKTCFKIWNNTQPLFSSKFDCSTQGIQASILSIDNSFENSEILQLSKNSNCNQFSIGLYRNGSNWVWSNGDTSTYTNWKSGYPTSDTTQNCVTFDQTSGTWTNVDCDSLQCYICQLSIQ